jgi:hypothetical protein
VPIRRLPATRACQVQLWKSKEGNAGGQEEGGKGGGEKNRDNLSQKITCAKLQKKLAESKIVEYSEKVLTCNDTCTKKVEELKLRKKKFTEEREKEKQEKELQKSMELAQKRKPENPSDKKKGSPVQPVNFLEQKNTGSEEKAARAIQIRLNQERNMLSPETIVKYLFFSGMIFLVLFVIYLKITE